MSTPLNAAGMQVGMVACLRPLADEKSTRDADTRADTRLRQTHFPWRCCYNVSFWMSQKKRETKVRKCTRAGQGLEKSTTAVEAGYIIVVDGVYMEGGGGGCPRKTQA